MALQEGYYEQPKRTTIKKLAAKMGIAPSTFQEIIQRTEHKVMMSSFEE